MFSFSFPFLFLFLFLFLSTYLFFYDTKDLVYIMV